MSKYVIYKVVIASKEEYIKTIIATLLKSIDLSRLILNKTALENKELIKIIKIKEYKIRT